MLDDRNVLMQHGVLEDLEIARDECEQMTAELTLENGTVKNVDVDNVIIVGMGGSGLASSVVKTWLEGELNVPMEVKKSYNLPQYVNEHTLVIACSCSGNTEETVSSAEQALERKAKLAIITSGGKLLDMAGNDKLPLVKLVKNDQPRMTLISQLRGMAMILAGFDLISNDKVAEIAGLYDWMRAEAAKWAPEVPTEQNYAKQLAKMTVGKTAAFFSGTVSAPAAYKLKICCNETAKNVAFWNQFPEFNHNEMMGWTSHPVEKPFAIYNVISKFEHPQIIKRFEITERLLSGKRPQAHDIKLQGESVLAELLWGCLLADFANIYLAALNGISPTNVDLVEKLKKEL